MRTVGRFSNAMEAMHFAAFLRASGIGDVQIFDKGDPWAGVLGVDVAVRDDDAERGESLRREYEQSTPSEADGEPPPAPDLSRLPESLAPWCPACGVRLPLKNLSACPGCGKAVDVPGLIVMARGPEALEVCYDRPVLTDEEAASVRAHCSRCHLPLPGRPVRGFCPECGQRFDKRSMPQSW